MIFQIDEAADVTLYRFLKGMYQVYIDRLPLYAEGKYVYCMLYVVCGQLLHSGTFKCTCTGESRNGPICWWAQGPRHPGHGEGTPCPLLPSIYRWWIYTPHSRFILTWSLVTEVFNLTLIVQNHWKTCCRTVQWEGHACLWVAAADLDTFRRFSGWMC